MLAIFVLDICSGVLLQPQVSFFFTVATEVALEAFSVFALGMHCFCSQVPGKAEMFLAKL